MTVAGFRSPDFACRTTYGAESDRLRDFFVPAMSRAVRYDRASGYFTSSALVSVARGLAEFLYNDGHMRLLAGAKLVDDDVTALEKGAPLDERVADRLLADPLVGESIIQSKRLEVLAWMVKEGRLEIRIAVPVGASGRPLTYAESHRYFHKKTGILTDANGDRLAFVGSNNESHSGLEEAGNLEEFSVYPSWKEEIWEWYGEPTVERFERQWNDQEANWRIIPLPEAVRASLIERVKHLDGPPAPEDPALVPDEADGERGREPDPNEVGREEAVGRLKRLLESPKRNGGTGVGLVTAPVVPWPHQLRIAHRIASTYPRSYLMADEVGMGKTIEAGLVFRELLLSGKAERILALVPASVIKQWQEELAEKFLMRIPRYEDGKYLFREGGTDEPAPSPSPHANPWSAFPVLLATSHLARRKERRQQVIQGGPWDVVFVDEAHHARRSGSKPDDTPNALLRLLLEMKRAGSWKALYLASATPMQMHAHEAWDLLQLLGLTERWGSSADAFVTYYEQLRAEPGERDWDFLRTMLADHLSSDDNQPTDLAVQRVTERVDRPLRQKRVFEFHERNDRASQLGQRPTNEREALDQWLRENTPMRTRVFRTTRPTLHRYKEEGLLERDTPIPVREVEDRFVEMTGAEARLYRKIEEYIRRFYNRYKNGPKAQRALGFIMTVYRRRLTSSFEAIKRSLQRRRDVLTQDDATLESLLDRDDEEALEHGTTMFDVEDLETAKLHLAQEQDQLDAFIADLEALPPDESKMRQLHEDLEAAFYGPHKTAIVFTQYGHTMDYIRDRLVGTYGAQVATWSGAGGTRYDPASKEWKQVPKWKLKDLFRAGDDVKILIGTDSLSEGLNLQTCGFVVNYDMPWNFMRVEQRIGRLDRIGGQPTVHVRNYFYRDTVEQQIYEGLAEDVDWFQNVVGPARPVLGQIESIIETAAMTPDDEAGTEPVESAIEKVRAGIREAEQQPVELDSATAEPYQEDPDPVTTLDDLKDELLSNPLTLKFLEPASDSETYLLRLPSGGTAHVTFARSVASERTGSVSLLTFGSDELEEVIRASGVVKD